MKCKFKILFIIFFTFLTTNIKPASYENYDLPTTVHDMLKNLKSSTPDHFWLSQSLNFLQSQNNAATASIFIKRQRYLANKIQRLHPKQD